MKHRNEIASVCELNTYNSASCIWHCHLSDFIDLVNDLNESIVIAFGILLEELM